MTNARDSRRNLRSRWRVLALLSIGALTLLAGCLVDDRYCVDRGDCPQGQLCNTLTSSCELEQCKGDSDCWIGGFSNGMSCVAGRCQFPLAQGRVTAPPFCLEVENPTSAYHGQSHCLADEKGKVVLIFFALLA